MQFPSTLQLSIENFIQKYGLSHLKAARKDLSERYRIGKQKQELMQSELHRIAYLLTRMPATFAAISEVLKRVKIEAPHLSITSLLDLGAGPGTASWAAKLAFDQLTDICLLEQDSQLIKMGKELMEADSLFTSSPPRWQMADMTSTLLVEPSDMVIFSYSIGELPINSLSSIIEQVWQLTKGALVIVEPGTPKGFERIRLARIKLIELGCFFLAPCPHQNSCPMANGDWCHFSTRLTRSSSHRLLKEGELGYEDEKFSYLVATKKQLASTKMRILRPPLKRSGHVHLKLCTAKGVQTPVISKKEKELYQRAKKANLGDPFSFDSADHDLE